MHALSAVWQRPPAMTDGEIKCGSSAPRKGTATGQQAGRITWESVCLSPATDHRKDEPISFRQGESHMGRRAPAFLFVLFIATSAAHAAVPGFVEDFNDGTAASFEGGAVETPIASGGVGGAADGYLMVSTPTVNMLAVRSSSPMYVGDLIADGVTGFSFWLNDLDQDDQLSMRLAIGAAGLNLWITTASFSPGVDAWTQYTVDLTDESQWMPHQGAGTFAQALANSDRILFRNDNPIAGDFALDRIQVLPEPASMILLALSSLAARRRHGNRA
jgi:hypothetical protein